MAGLTKPLSEEDKRDGISSKATADEAAGARHRRKSGKIFL